MGGKVVHAVAGNRTQYQPMVSCWTPLASDPLQLTSLWRKKLGLCEYYVADLDALEHRGSQQEIVQQLIQNEHLIWLDAGMDSALSAASWMERGGHRLIVSSESLISLSLLAELTQLVDVRRIVFSLDLHAGVVRCRPDVFELSEPIRILDTIAELGIEQVIILDTAVVGRGQGPSTVLLCERVKKRLPQLSLVSGGGVRNIEDIAVFQQSGVDRVLVSTWLHTLSTTIADGSIDSLVR